MAATLFDQSPGLHGPTIDVSSSPRVPGNFPLRFPSRRFPCNARIFRKESCTFTHHKLPIALASSSHASALDPSTVNSAVDFFPRLQQRNLFTGSVDVPLTKRGVEEAMQADMRISNIPVDIIYTSSLIRVQMTAMLAMTQHRHKKVTIFVHDESERAKIWQGLNKQETAEIYEKEQVLKWPRSFDIPPLNGESLEMCSQRAVTYFKDCIESQLEKGKNVMVAAHGNSLTSIIMYLARLTSQEVINLELSTGVPLLYIYKDGNFISRGSPVGPTEASVYAYTRRLALYRQHLDEMSH